VLSRFIARLIIDECIDSNYISDMTLLNPESEVAIDTVYETFTLLFDDSSRQHADIMWTKSVSLQNAKDFYDIIVKEFMETGNKERTVEELKKSQWEFFNHEFVRRLCIAAFKDASKVKCNMRIG
jgi:hypothetical protein